MKSSERAQKYKACCEWIVTGIFCIFKVWPFLKTQASPQALIVNFFQRAKIFNFLIILLYYDAPLRLFEFEK